MKIIEETTGLPYNSVLTHGFVTVVGDNAGGRTLSVNLNTEDHDGKEHLAYVVMSPANARRLAHLLLSYADEAEG